LEKFNKRSAVRLVSHKSREIVTIEFIISRPACPSQVSHIKLLASTMGYTLYDGTIVVVQGILNTLSHILNQAEQRPDASALLEARLYEDMYPLTDQVRLATQFSENLVARLTGREPVTFKSNLTTFANFYERIETVLKVLNKADKDIVNQHGDMIEATSMGPEKAVEMSGAMYAHSIALPNIYFHVATAYGILRKEGVPLSKLDYYVGFFPQQLAGSQETKNL
jgi:hypothetical protein